VIICKRWAEFELYLKSTFLINYHHLSTSNCIAMSDLLIEPKLTVLKQMKTLPEAPMAEEEDFALWGIQFCKVLVGRTIAIVFTSPKDCVGGLSCIHEGLGGRG
jgi:hypothetical protein